MGTFEVTVVLDLTVIMTERLSVWSLIDRLRGQILGGTRGKL
jgi:hypothetical protein